MDGAIVWRDLTVPNADRVRDFYAQVVGWESTGMDMGDYEDYVVGPPGGGPETKTGVCWARGTNAEMPPVWMIYIQVPSVSEAVRLSAEAGGACVHGPRQMGEQSFAVLRDPAGALFGVIGPA